MHIRLEVQGRAGHLTRSVRSVLPRLWQGVGAVIVVVGGSIWLVVDWGIKHYLVGLLLLLFVLLMVIFEGSYQQQKRTMERLKIRPPTAHQAELEALRALAIEGDVMKSRIPPEDRLGLFTLAPGDLLDRFQHWETEVCAALTPWPKLRAQFKSDPITKPSIFGNYGPEQAWQEIGHRTTVLRSIVEGLDGDR